MKHKIYKITNDLNDFVYVGYTSNTLKWRLNKHFEEARNNNTSKRKIYQAINNLGEPHFSIQLLFECEDKSKALGEKEQEFIELHDSIDSGYNSRKGGGGVHLTDSMHKKTDVYNKNNNLIQTFPSRTSAANFIGCSPELISIAIANADKNKGSQVRGFWVCHHKCSPGYKIPNTKPGSDAARKINTGKKRPTHSNYMKENPSNVDNNNYSFIHKSGHQFEGTRRQLIETFPSHNISSSELGMLIRGKYKTHRGWKIK